jgi:hypothetical protein
MQKVVLYESTRVSCSVGLGMYSKEQERKIHTELYIVGTKGKLSFVRIPIVLCPTLYIGYQKRGHSHSRFVRRMREQSYQRMVTLLKRRSLQIVFYKKFKKIPVDFTRT